MMDQMMKECCGKEGKPDFEKMKKFMEMCGCSCTPKPGGPGSAQTATDGEQTGTEKEKTGSNCC